MATQPACALTYETVIDYLKTVDTPMLANAIELLGIRPNHEGFTPGNIRCLFPELGQMCGYAVTAHVETISRTDGNDRRKFMDLYEAVEQSRKPAVVVFQEVGAYPNYAAHCGEEMGTIFTRLGAAGLVTDACVRDIHEVRAMGFRYFARGAVASHANFRIVRVSTPVQVMGFVIHPGDILHGDVNGVLHVPQEAVNQLPAMVERVRRRESGIFEYVRGPQFTLEGLRKLVLP